MDSLKEGFQYLKFVNKKRFASWEVNLGKLYIEMFQIQFKKIIMSLFFFADFDISKKIRFAKILRIHPAMRECK